MHDVAVTLFYHLFDVLLTRSDSKHPTFYWLDKFCLQPNIGHTKQIVPMALSYHLHYVH